MAKTKARIGPSEDDGAILAAEIIQYIERNSGQFLRDGNGALHAIVNGQRIPINLRNDNLSLAGLVFDACEVSTSSREARVALQRVQVYANRKAGRLQMRKFSAVAGGGNRLYIPIDGGKLLCVTPESLQIGENGKNQDALWVESPVHAFGWVEENDAVVSLADFERLLVNTQACQQPAMKWFVAMHEGLFPFVRDFCPARFLLVHIGDSQSGKTSGAERFTLLHGLGAVKGDFSVAALSNIGDIGLVAMDNKEQSDLSPEYINFLLFLSTGAERGRSYRDGRMRTTDTGRPVGVITSIEGVAVKAELRKRCVDVQYAVKGDRLSRAIIEREILKLRNSINSAFVEVLKWFFVFQIEGAGTFQTPNPIPEFEEHFTVLCNLLRAFGLVAGKSDEWAEEIIQSWGTLLSQREVEESILEHPLLEVLTGHKGNDPDLKIESVSHDGRKGRLVVTDCGALLSKLNALDSSERTIIPDTPAGLSRRLRSTQFKAFSVLDEERAPNISILKRTAKRRPIGFFFPDDGE